MLCAKFLRKSSRALCRGRVSDHLFEFLAHKAQTSQAQVVTRHSRLHPQPWNALLHESRVLQLGKGKLDDEVSGRVSHVVLHPCRRGLWPRRNTAQAFENLKGNVHSFVYMQTSGAENGRSVTEDEIFYFSEND